ncbi:MAG: DEAD/DEAH box helicase family protein, partial [Phycisphaerales bacterium]|nr:DEAD/DEAH box helicase family protein [Phycisphaerales bacterium]
MIDTDRRFQLTTDMTPTGDQPAAIEALVKGVNAAAPHQVLLGATGTGKTFTMAQVIQRTQKPTLILSHNKTLAAKQYQNVRAPCPQKAYTYVVADYDKNKPDADTPQRHIYI